MTHFSISSAEIHFSHQTKPNQHQQQQVLANHHFIHPLTYLLLLDDTNAFPHFIIINQSNYLIHSALHFSWGHLEMMPHRRQAPRPTRRRHAFARSTPRHIGQHSLVALIAQDQPPQAQLRLHLQRVPPPLRSPNLL